MTDAKSRKRGGLLAFSLNEGIDSMRGKLLYCEALERGAPVAQLDRATDF